jgi:hypothetical protein
VIAVDTNILVYAHRREVREHPTALEALRTLAVGPGAWAIPWPCLYEFFGVVTNPRIWKQQASTPLEAWAQINGWLGAPSLRVIGETDEFASVLAGIVQRPRVRGPVVHDARIAAICIAHGVTRLLTRDRDFSLFPELVVDDPLG